jgi:hypothetical protein
MLAQLAGLCHERVQEMETEAEGANLCRFVYTVREGINVMAANWAATRGSSVEHLASVGAEEEVRGGVYGGWGARG